MIKKVLITGVYGLIAWAAYQRFRDRGDETYGLARRKVPSERVGKSELITVPEERLFLADLRDYDAVRKAVEGMETVIHLAADPRPDTAWENILNSNIIGTHNVFEACRQERVKRIVYGSSIMTNWGYWNDEPYKAIRESRFEGDPREIPIVTHLDPPRPTEHYSASKVWGETLARVYAEIHGISCICIRIGGVTAEDKPRKPEVSSLWSSQRDIVALIERCVDAPESMRFDIFYGISNNRYCWVDTSRARNLLGYLPQDSAEAISMIGSDKD